MYEALCEGLAQGWRGFVRRCCCCCSCCFVSDGQSPPEGSRRCAGFPVRREVRLQYCSGGVLALVSCPAQGRGDAFVWLTMLLLLLMLLLVGLAAYRCCVLVITPDEKGCCVQQQCVEHRAVCFVSVCVWCVPYPGLPAERRTVTATRRLSGREAASYSLRREATSRSRGGDLPGDGGRAAAAATATADPVAPLRCLAKRHRRTAAAAAPTTTGNLAGLARAAIATSAALGSANRRSEAGTGPREPGLR